LEDEMLIRERVREFCREHGLRFYERNIRDNLDCAVFVICGKTLVLTEKDVMEGYMDTSELDRRLKALLP
jgi:hypothetical protein